MKHALTLDEWVERNCPTLLKQVRIHIEQYIDDHEDVEQLTRLIMISFRQETE